VVDVLCTVTAPCLLVFEDVHWADEASTKVLAAIADRGADAPLGVVATRRATPPAFTDAPEGGNVTSIALNELSADELATVVRDTWSRLGGGELPASYIATVVERSAGSPLFAATVAELVRRSFQPGRPLPPVPLPDELLPFLTAHLDELGDGPQRVALCSAVLGRGAPAAELAAVFGLDRGETHRDLRALIHAGIARPDTRRVEAVWLRHATVAEALLARASHADRAPLHARVCSYLVDVGASAREVARHLEHCSLPDLELAGYRGARTEAWSTSALVEARHWGELALSAGGGPEDLVALAEIEQQLGECELAAERLATLGPDAALQGTVERLLGRIAFETGRLDDAIEHLERAEQAGERGAPVSWPLTMALCDLGQFDKAQERATEQLRAAGHDDRQLRLDALANLGVVAVRKGDLPAAAAAIEEARKLAAELGDLVRLAHVTGDLAGVRFTAGRVAEAAVLLAEATALAHSLGARRLVAMTLGNLTHVRLAGGDRDGAVRTAAASVRACLAIRDVGIALDCLQGLVIATELAGELDRAALLWRRHALLEETLGRRHDAAVSWLRAAALLAACDDTAEGRAAITRADSDASDLATAELDLHRQRALAALRGELTTPPEQATAHVNLPPLDAALPAVTPETVDQLFAAVARHVQALAHPGPDPPDKPSALGRNATPRTDEDAERSGRSFQAPAL
jgi:tetratricopeptide (TPR) repeat protein